MIDMRVRIREQAELAVTYAEDGAYHSAARVLLALAAETEAHATAADEAINELVRQKFKGGK